MSSYLRNGVLRFASPLMFFALWEIFSRSGALPHDTFSRPSEVVVAGFEAFRDGEIVQRSIQTLAAALIAVVIAFFIALPWGVLIGMVWRLSAASNVTINILRSIPPVALIPLVVMALGFSLWTDVVVAVWSCIWVFLVSASSAVKMVDPRTMEVARLLNFSLFERIYYFAMPSMLAPLFTALRLSLSVAFVMVVTCEIAANPRGLGYAMMEAQQALQADLVYANLIWLAVLGWTIDKAMLLLKRRSLSWA